MWFPKFPYTNFSQINLDWVLRQIRELSEWMNRYFKDIRADLDKEINDRIEADKAEAAAREEADQKLQTNIDTETQERKDADAAEKAAREAADQQLQNNIDALRGDAILKDGSTTTTAAIPFAQGIKTTSIGSIDGVSGISIESDTDMNNHKITGLEPGTEDRDAVNKEQMDTADMVVEAAAKLYTDTKFAETHSVPPGGNSGQVLAKIDGTDYNTTWVDQQGGGGTGNVPAGGTTGQVLAKSTDADYQTHWVNQPEGLPTGGATGQVVTKTDGGAEWANAPSGLPAGGTTGQVVTKTDSGAEWANAPSGLPAGGTTGQVVTKTDSGAEWADAGGKWKMVFDTEPIRIYSNGQFVMVNLRGIIPWPTNYTNYKFGGINYKRGSSTPTTPIPETYRPFKEVSQYSRVTTNGTTIGITISTNGNIAIIITAAYLDGREETPSPSFGTSEQTVAIYPITNI